MTDLIKLAQEYRKLNLPNCPKLRREMLAKIFNLNDDKEYHHVAISRKSKRKNKSKRSQYIA